MKIKKILNNKKILVAVAIVVAAFLRLYKLSIIPLHLSVDEAALGYNAYSILKTGKDEYGQFLPLIFKSFGDYKPGLYVYSAVPFIATLGLTEIAVRLPSAVAGILAVYLVYKIAEYFVKEEDQKSLWRYFPIIAIFMAAINPWHVFFSRGAWEVNLSLTLTLAGIYFFQKARDKIENLYASAVFFSLTLLTYQGAKLSTLIVLAVLLFVYFKDIKEWMVAERKVVLKALLLGFLISFPVLLSLFQGKTGRLRVFSVFSYPRKEGYLKAFLDEGGEKVGSISYYLFHSESVNFLRGIIGRWFNHYSDRFLFFEGDWQDAMHNPPNQGMMIIAQILFITAGIASLIKRKGKIALFVFIWSLLGPLPAVLSRNQVHAVRAYNFLVPLVLMASAGCVFLIENVLRLKKVLIKKFLLVSMGVVYMLSFFYFLDSYFVHLPKHTTEDLYWGYKQIVETVKPIQKNYEKITIEQSFDQPYIYFLFYGGAPGQGYLPEDYQKQAELIDAGLDVGRVEHLDNICFCDIDWEVKGYKRLLVVKGFHVPPQGLVDSGLMKVIKEIKYPDENLAFRILQIDKKDE